MDDLIDSGAEAVSDPDLARPAPAHEAALGLVVGGEVAQVDLV